LRMAIVAHQFGAGPMGDFYGDFKKIRQMDVFSGGVGDNLFFL
jgi:hypothetical protein